MNKFHNYRIRFLVFIFLSSTVAEAIAGSVAISLEDKKPYNFSLTIATNVGYDSNAIQLGDGLPLPPENSRQDYGFFTIDAIVGFDWTSADENQKLELTYEFFHQFYEGLSGSDEGDHVFDAIYTQVFNETWSAVFDLTDKYVTIDGQGYSNRVSLKPRIDYQMTPYLATRLAVAFAKSDTFFPVTIPARNPDANIYSVELTEVIKLKSSNSFSLKPSYGHFWNDGTGSDYQYDRDRLQVALGRRASDDSSSRWHDLSVVAKYIHDFDRYDNLHSRAGPTGFLFKRKDDRDTLNIVLTFDLIKERNHINNLAINLEYLYVRNDSNIAVYNYDEHIITLGASIKFQ